MALYVDGFVVPVKTERTEDYRAIAQQAGELWREYGALEYRECVADDVKAGEVTSFPQSVNLEDDETVIFAWIVYESRAARDDVNAKVMDDERMKEMMDPNQGVMDPKRMFFGGFEMIVDI